MGPLALRPYQTEAITALQGGDGRRLVSLPTGTGKTVIFSELIRQRDGTALILAHRDELLQQAADKLRSVAPELALTIGFVQAGRNDVHSPIVLASVQTLASAKRLAQLPSEFDTVVIDEAHHATADSYRRILEHVTGSGLIVGFTATPERADRSDLRDVFDTLSYGRSLEEMIREGYLCDLQALRITLEDLDLAKVKKSRGDFQADDLGRAMHEAHAVEHVIAAYDQHALGKRTVAFFPTVAMSAEAAAAFTAAGIRAVHLDGTTPSDERRAMLANLSTGAVEVVCNVGVLTEGFDEPSLQCIIIAAPTRSRIKYAQMVGRGTRLYPGKTDCLILDLAGVSDDLTLQSVGMLFGLTKPPKRGETALQARDRELADEAAVAAAAGREPSATDEAAKARKLSAQRRNIFNREAIQWVHVGDRWALGLKDQVLVLDHHADGPAGWRVLLLRENANSPTGMSYRVAARNLDLGYAQGAAEHLVRQHAAVALADKHAPWRDEPATRGQRGRLWHMGVKVPSGVTKGDAADLITRSVALQRLERFDRSTAGVPA